MPGLIRQTELADRMGVNRKEVTKWKKDGRLVMKGKLVDYDATVKLLAETSDPARSSIKKSNKSNKSNSGKMSYVDARTNRILIGLAREQLKYQTEKDELVNAQAVILELKRAHTIIMNRLRSISSFIHLDISQIYGVVNAKKQKEVSIIVRKHIDDILKELSEWKPTKS